LDFYSASSLKQSAGRNNAMFEHIILISSQPVLLLMLNGETANTNFIVIALGL